MIPTRIRLLSRSFTTFTNEKPWYITTPIFYPNASPHIGHLYSLVTADIFARYHRLENPDRPVHFVTGTDEHGSKIQKAAMMRGMEPRTFCDEISEHFRRLAKGANISHTTFIRTSEERHLNTVHHVWRQLESKNLIYRGTYTGWYSITDECFYTDSQVIHPSPQSEESTPISKETSSPVEFTQETNYMFRLSSLQDKLLSHFLANPDFIYPSNYPEDIIHSLKNEPLQDISISRPRSRVKWGVEVPGDPEHTVYVWVDAVLSYLTGIGYPWNGVRKHEDMGGWPVDLQVIGKDIVRFHAIYLPAILLALELPLQTRILAHAHWTSSQKKMSKSLGNTTDPFQAIEEFGLDSVRWYLTRVGGKFRDDVDWSHDQLSKHHKEFQSLLGNFFLRVTSNTILKRVQDAQTMLKQADTDQAVPISNQETKNWFQDMVSLQQETNKYRAAYADLLEATTVLPDKITQNLRKLDVADAMEEIVDVLRIANRSLSDVAPWSPSSSSCAALVTAEACLETLRVVGICLQPFAPDVAGRLLDALGVEERTWMASKKRGTLNVHDVKGVKLFRNEKDRVL
ncbi:hypothetical protein E1B28_004777 [Marasmius oreades]|uniref:Probable methionine--tRNA ligase, mitochondrial n=1 Tax=Marasmius oreades TaxID=181124 RepID=A0A9P7UZC8_9AGAR|nr:uncharacterized protein E1B28_004777 [Marasmius oreades]KAG7097433.1 hypothetical protein E1B28_004777 [Marasmius oreades]